MDTVPVAQTIAERVERELERVKAARPGLASRVERAENIVVTHLSCRRQRVIRVRVRDGRVRFLVASQGLGGAVYVVDPACGSCSCPGTHRHGKGCKHALACWTLWWASARPALPSFSGGVDPGNIGEIVGEAVPASPARLLSCAGCGGRFHGRHLVEVQDFLRFFEGDLLRHECWRGSDAMVL